MAADGGNDDGSQTVDAAAAAGEAGGEAGGAEGAARSEPSLCSWLESIKGGFGQRFAKAFGSLGIDVVQDVRPDRRDGTYPCLRPRWLRAVPRDDS